MSAEETADLMDAIHNIPWLIENWEQCDIEFLRREFLQVYDRRWGPEGGLHLCEIFDQMVSETSPTETA